MWIPKIELIELGLSEATIWRRMKSGEFRWRYGKRTGARGKPPIEIEVESLPSEIQFKIKKHRAECGVRSAESEPDLRFEIGDLKAGDRGQGTGGSAECGVRSAESEEYGAGAVAGLTENESNHPPIDERLQRLAAALARFGPPEYEMKHREAVERRCDEMAEICDTVLSFQRRGSGRKLSVESPGSREAGLNRAYHPDLKRLAARAACTDPIYVEMYPSSKQAPSVGTLLKIAKAYREKGRVAFIREKQTLRPELDERFLEVPIEAVNWLQERFESYSSAAISRFGKVWLEAMRRHGVKMPFTDWRPSAPGSCYAWLYRWYRKIPQTTFILATKGQLQLEARVSYIIRRYEDVKPREIWTMDWKQFDVCYWLPATKPGGEANLVREWLCPTLDVASRAPFGFQIQDRPNARGVTEAYLDAVLISEWKTDAYAEVFENEDGTRGVRVEPSLSLLCGMQRAAEGSQPSLHLDNGKDFRSFAIDGKESKLKGFGVESGLKNALGEKSVFGEKGISLSADFDLRIRNAKVRNAKAKIVEPWFKYAIGLWEETMPGYCGSKPEKKPHWFAAAVRLHRAFSQRRPPKPADYRELPKLWREVFDKTEAELGGGTPFLSAQEFRNQFILRLREYLRSPHESLRDAIGDVSPLAYLEANAEAPHMLSEQAAYALLMVPRVVAVKDGEIVLTFYNERIVYRAVASEISDAGALHRLPTKETVEVRYNSKNLGRVLVMSSGSAICWAENPEKLNWGASEADFRAANMEKKRRDAIARENDKNRFEPEPDWRREIEGRENVIAIPMPKAVNESNFHEDRSPLSEITADPWGRDLAKPVAVITRFDRKDGTGRKGRRGDAGTRGRGEGLRLAPAIEEDGDDLFGEDDPQMSQISDEGDGFSDLL